MPKRNTFEIAFVGLKPGVHEFKYEVNDEFFSETESRDFSNCNALIKLQLEKKTGFMLLKFEIGGKADVICDRCGNNITKELWDEFSIVVKMVDGPEEMNEQEADPDIFYISKTESHLYLNEWIYEFVTLSIPSQKTCGEDEQGGSKCNNEVLEMLKNMEARTEEHNANNIWKGLDRFKKIKKK